MNVLKILETVMDGPHLRTSIYFSGCTHHCKECHNPETWKFGQGTQYTPLELLEEVEKYGNKYVTLSGGDPLEQNLYDLAIFLYYLKSHEYNVWCYTGYTYEELIKNPYNIKILSYIDVLVDGEFKIDLKSDSCQWRGSANQRVIDVQKSLEQNKIILWQ